MLPVAQDILHTLFNLVPALQESPTATPIVSGSPVVTATTGALTPIATATPAAGAAVTPVVTATAEVVVTPFPTPAPTPVPSPWSMGQWFHVTGWQSSFHTVFLVFFILVAIAAVVAYVYYAQRRFKAHTLNAHLAERVSYALTGFAAVGLLLLFFALAKTPLLSLPIWLILTMIAFIAFVIYGGYYYRTAYPAEVMKYDHEQERLKYIPKGRGKGPAYTPPMKKKQQKQSKQERKKSKASRN